MFCVVVDFEKKSYDCHNSSEVICLTMTDIKPQYKSIKHTPFAKNGMLLYIGYTEARVINNHISKTLKAIANVSC